jgi:hypothetical protein
MTLTGGSNPNYYKPEAVVGKDGNAQFGDIQAAIDHVETMGGGVVGLKRGTYTIQGLRIEKAVSLIGAGIGATLIILDDNSDCPMIECDGSGIYLGERLKIEDLTLNGNKDNQNSGSGIKLIKTNRVKIDNIEVTQCKDTGIWDNGSFGTRIIDSFINNCRNGIYGNPNGIEVDGLNVHICRLADLTETGIFINGDETYQPANIILGNNIFGDNIGSEAPHAAVKLDYTKKVNISDSIFKTLYSPLYVHNSDRVEASDLTFANLTAGLQLAGNTNSYWRDIIDNAGAITNGTL